MQKKDYIEQIRNIDNSYTQSELKKKNNDYLEKLLSDLKEDAKDQEELVDDTDKVESKDDEIDLEALKEQMKREALEEARKEVMSEMDNQKEDNGVRVAKSYKDAIEGSRYDVYYQDEIDLNMNVPVMNLTNGGLTYKSKQSGAVYRWEEYGDVQHMSVQELTNVRGSDKKFFDEPFVLVLNEQVVKYLRLERNYENINYIEDVLQLFKMNDDEFKRIVKSSPKGIKHTITTKGVREYRKGNINSLSKLRFLEQEFDIHIID